MMITRSSQTTLTLLLIVCITYAFLESPTVDAERIEELSFKPPFEVVDKNGQRVVNDTWTYGGSTEVKKHFVRLTTDRQSKKGYLWQKQPLGRDEFSAILTFRISGQVKNWFGDGIGVWFTKHRTFTIGANHGFTDKYTGVGIILDTYVNKDHKGGHKDVSVLVNDGTKNMEQLNTETRVGCDAMVRYYEQSAAFDPVHSMSRLKIKIKKNRLALEVDASASGQWEACYDAELPFSPNWLTETTLGISAATGAVADNHDIIRFDAYSEFYDTAMGLQDSEIIMHKVSKDYKKWLDSPNCGVDCLIAVLSKEFQNFRVEAEHRFTDLKEKTDNTVAKLKKQEKENEKRVADLTTKLSKKIDSTLDVTDEKFGMEMKDKITKQLNANPGITGGWKTPFFLLLIVLSGGAFFVYRKYQALMKSHLL